jgi:hypothetical protein
MPGGRYRDEGRSGYGAAIVVSDGTTPVDLPPGIYHLNDHLYTQQPEPPKYPSRGRTIPQEEISTMTAADLARNMAHRARGLKSAILLPDETISLG